MATLGVHGLGLAGIEQARAQSTPANTPLSDTAVIFIWLPGGPPHMETYDMKPDAPSDYRGEFQPIKTNVPGIDAECGGACAVVDMPSTETGTLPVAVGVGFVPFTVEQNCGEASS